MKKNLQKPYMLACRDKKEAVFLLQNFDQNPRFCRKKAEQIDFVSEIKKVKSILDDLCKDCEELPREIKALSFLTEEMAKLWPSFSRKQKNSWRHHRHQMELVAREHSRQDVLDFLENMPDGHINFSMELRKLERRVEALPKELNGKRDHLNSLKGLKRRLDSFE